MARFISYFNLHQDQDTPEAIDETIRDGVQIVGTNLWVLMFAILIASVGLNVNSTAVIIGAMLISPLMGPIIGIGYGAGINDARLIRLSARNLGAFVAISLFASTFYFLLTPLSQAHSELLSRTSPTIWDVLIAFFGGSAGIVALTRQKKTTVIPGVAIATALMPPLCTAGYGLAMGNFSYFFGAFYLFIINGVFIAFATLFFVKLMRLPQHSFQNEAARRRSNFWILLTALITMLPSTYLAYRMVQDEFFTTAAERFIHDIERDQNLFVLGKTLDATARTIELVISGKNLPPDYAKSLEKQLANYDLPKTHLHLRTLESGNTEQEVSLLRQQLQQDLTGNLMKNLEDKTNRIHELEQQLQSLHTGEAEQASLFKEIRAQYPVVVSLLLARGTRQDLSDSPQNVLVAVIGVTSLPGKEDQERLHAWLGVRYPQTLLHVSYEVEKPAEKRAEKPAAETPTAPPAPPEAKPPAS